MLSCKFLKCGRPYVGVEFINVLSVPQSINNQYTLPRCCFSRMRSAALAVMFLGNSKSSEITMQQFEVPPSLRQFEKPPSLRLPISDWDSESEFLRCLKLNVKLIMLFLFYKYFNFISPFGLY